MPLAGAGYGASQGLEQALDRRLREEIAQQQNEERKALLEQRKMEEANRVKEAEARQTFMQSQQARQDAQDILEQTAPGEITPDTAATLRKSPVGAARVTDRKIIQGVRPIAPGIGAMDESGPQSFNVLEPTQAQARQAHTDAEQASLVNGLSPQLKTIYNLKKIGIDLPAPKRDPIADHEAMAQIDAKYRRPEAGARTPQFVRMPDGSVKDLNGIAPAGAVPFDPVSARQADASGGRAAEGMRQYRDAMLNVVNGLLDDKGELRPSTASVVGSFEGAIPEGAFFDEGKQTALSGINRLQSLLNLEKLGEMKSQSRTGASGFGALSEKELAVLEAAASTLRNRRQGDVSYRDELRRIREELTKGGNAGANAGITAKADTLPKDDAAAAAQALIDKARAARKP